MQTCVATEIHREIKGERRGKEKSSWIVNGRLALAGGRRGKISHATPASNAIFTDCCSSFFAARGCTKGPPDFRFLIAVRQASGLERGERPFPGQIASAFELYARRSFWKTQLENFEKKLGGQKGVGRKVIWKVIKKNYRVLLIVYYWILTPRAIGKIDSSVLQCPVALKFDSSSCAATKAPQSRQHNWIDNPLRVKFECVIKHSLCAQTCFWTPTMQPGSVVKARRAAPAFERELILKNANSIVPRQTARKPGSKGRGLRSSFLGRGAVFFQAHARAGNNGPRCRINLILIKPSGEWTCTGIQSPAHFHGGDKSGMANLARCALYLPRPPARFRNPSGPPRRPLESPSLSRVKIARKRKIRFPSGGIHTSGSATERRGKNFPERWMRCYFWLARGRGGEGRGDSMQIGGESRRRGDLR